MLIRIRTADGKDIKIDISKCTTSLENLQDKIEQILNVPKDRQVLYFAGKQLVNNNKLIDYGIDQNHVLILREKSETHVSDSIIDNGTSESSSSNLNDEEVTNSQFFKVGDLVDAMDEDGTWSNGKVVKITKKVNHAGSQAEDSFDHFISFYETYDSVVMLLENLRPRMEHIIPFLEVNVGDEVLVNYNVEEPKQRGSWYIMRVTSKIQQKKTRRLVGTLLPSELEKCEVFAVDEIYKVEERMQVVGRTDEDEKYMVSGSGNPRKKAISCCHCFDNPSKKCRECSCVVCGGKEDEHLQLLCQECEQAYHTTCLKPPLESVPEDDWYCHQCRNTDVIVKPGETFKMTKKRLSMPSAHQEKPMRDWGKGMACVGRTKKCTIVKDNHFGEIPGVEVGTSWKYRITASEAGVHRPPVSGIHGRESEGAYSIVLSGGYEDDVDDGNEFLYTGSGGRDLSGNKRTSEQCCDQKLTRMNLALARNCNAPVDTEKGAKAKNWKAGKPVRVLRKQKSKKHPSDYAPDEGFRYDGLYKVVKYFPVKGASGFIVWRYQLRRDDPIPAPWTPEGQARIKNLGLKLIVPEGYEEEKPDENSTVKPKKKRAKAGDTSEITPPKKRKKEEKDNRSIAFILPKGLQSTIDNDKLNKHLWHGLKETASEGKPKFLDAIQQAFTCVCCLELVSQPVTTDCKHTMCEGCLKRAFGSVGHTCPHCRFDLGSNFKITINKILSKILLDLFPGYNNGR